jgi:hypothetical protein
VSRWIDRAHVELARLPAGSQGRLQQELAIRRMEHDQLRPSLRRAQDRLSRLPRRSDERRQLERAISRMEEDYNREDREIRIYSVGIRRGVERGGSVLAACGRPVRA